MYITEGEKTKIGANCQVRQMVFSYKFTREASRINMPTADSIYRSASRCENKVSSLGSWQAASILYKLVLDGSR